MARTRAGLTEEDVATLRAALQDRKRPRVVVAGQQFGGESTGLVVGVGDPAGDGPEFVQVRVTLDGLTDVLRFAPKELRLPQRAAAARRTTGATKRKPAARTPTVAAVTPTPESAPAAPTKTAPTKAAPTKAAPTKAAPTKAAPTAAAPRPTARRGSRAQGNVRVPVVTITISSSGTNWTVAATRGGRSVLKNASVPPGVVAAAVDLLGEPAVAAAVEEVNGAALTRAQQRAEELRSELAQVESLLAAHRSPGR